MSDSRYAPPRAAVADLEPAHPLIPRPAQVARALRWLWASFGLDLMISTWVWFNTTVLALPERVGSALGQIVFALITVWAYRAVAKGRNWARNLVAGLTVLGVIVVAATLLGTDSHSGTLPELVETVSNCVTTGMDVYGVCLLFGAAARAWFREMKARA
jgi:hypothetical protein